MSLEAGTQLDQYRLVEKIGEGGMGVVWKARDTTLDRDVAIKVLPRDFVADPERLARFEREAKSVAALSHPNIVAIYGFGSSDDVSYAAMELLDGRTLRELLEEGPLPVRKAIDIACQIADGLGAAHSKGIVHRDLKPENVFVTPDGRVRILDFGLAATEPGAGISSEAVTRTELTDPGTVMGTVGYMAPEQVRGEKADPRSDLFALGAILYEMLTGERSFARETTAETMTAILREEPPDPIVGGQGAPAPVARVVRRCLEKSPDQRFQTARDLAFALDNAQLDSSTSVSAPPVHPPAERTRGRHLAWLVIPLSVAAAFAIGWLLRPATEPMPPPRISQLTFTGADRQPSVSPDGRLIAFTSSRTGVSQIWVRQVDGGSEQPLTEGSDWRPQFSPDGSSISFIRREDDGYSAYRVPVVGGQPRQLIETVLEVEWSPDGKRLAFLRGGAAEETRSGSAIGTALGVLDLETGEDEILVRFENWELYGLAWSPDGRRIATAKVAIQGGASNWRLLLVEPDGGRQEELGIGSDALVSYPTWAGPQALIYATSSTSVNAFAPNAVLRRDLESGVVTTLLWQPYLFPFRGTLIETTRLALLSETSLVFDTFQTVQTIREHDRAGGTVELVREGVSVDRQPAYSPDGSRVIFTSNRSGNVDLFSWERGSGRLLQLTDHPDSDWDPAYTPDGESILFSSDRGGNLEIWMAEADGSNPRQVSSDGVDAENPTMTADGEWIVYSSGNPDGSGIFKIRPDGSDVTTLLSGNWINPEISPDGRYALTVTTDAALLRNAIRVVEIATGELTDFSILIEYDPQSPNVTFGRGRWLPDGSAIAYIGPDEQEHIGIWVQDFEPGVDTADTRRPLIEFRPDQIVETFGISPDGEHVAVSTLRTIQTLKLAEGLPPLR